MSRRLSRFSLALVILLSTEVWALGLGSIRMNSALNEPLNARVELLSATPEELDNLKLGMASSDTFERYGLDRPFFLQDIQFNIVRSGSADGNYIVIRSGMPVAEPFLTFLVEASWSRGRLLREYTVFLDPPMFAPPAADSAPVVQAPSSATPSNSGRIERQAPVPAPAPTRQTTPQQPKPQPVADDTPFDTSTGADFNVRRGQTLWTISSQVRPDRRLSMNQTMLAIFAANPEAFGGNINILRAGAGLRIPSADEIFRISRGEALTEAQRQHAEWVGGTVPPVDRTTARPSLTLVPPDDDFADGTTEPDSQFGDEPLTREGEIERRIAELEGADVPQQESLIEIRDNELAALREELARIRGEVYEPPADDIIVDDTDDGLTDEDPFADTDDIMVDDTTVVDDADDAATAIDEQPADIIRAATRSEPSLVDRVVAAITSIWAIIILVSLALVGGALFWFMRRGDDDEEVDSWEPLDSDEIGSADLSPTESLRVPLRIDESILVVEQETALESDIEATVDAPAPIFAAEAETDAEEATGQFGSLEDTFSSETAINLDQTDPIAEADFHMAYGLYDQAADLVNGALAVESERVDLLMKLCEIYFVWGNRDAFVDAAGRLHSVVGEAESSDWNKIVIMGQQIAADDALFAGASAAGATKAVDLSFETDMDEAGALDMEFIGDDDGAGDIVELGGDEETAALEAGGDGVDFFIDSVADETALAGIETTVAIDSGAVPDFEVTRELPTVDATAEVPVPVSTVETLGDAIESSGKSADETAEINLDDLGLNIDDLAETELASLDDLDATSENAAFSDTEMTRALEDLADDLTEVTGKNPQIDLDDTGVQIVLGGDSTILAPENGNEAAEDGLADDVEIILAGLDDDDAGVSDFDFAKTEALPTDVFTGDANLDETGELPAIAATDVDLDLDDLTAALKVSEVGDTIEQFHDDATVEQARPNVAEDTEGAGSVALAPDNMTDDLSDARTMTEVGTKLDLARAYVDMGDPNGARSILEEVLDEGDEGQRQQAQQLLDSLPS